MLAVRSVSLFTRRTFATSARVFSEGAPSGTRDTSFNKRERAEEDRYVWEQEAEKLKALAQAIEKSKANLNQLEKDHAQLKKMIEEK